MTGEGEPYYQNELSIYKEETLKKIEDFRRARSNFGTQRNINQTIYTNVKKDLEESYIYRGRCVCLRKLRLKTTFLLYHFKTLKPLRYYTLKKKVADYDKFDFEIESKEHEEEDITLRTLEETCSTRQLWTREAVEECFKDAYNTKGRRDRAEKKKECMRKRPSGPCKEVMRKLKAGSFKGGIIESCKCEDGREVTVVIKGICLCDKSNLNNINLNRVCDEYSKMVNKVPEAEFPSAINPQETHAEPLGQRAVVKNNDQKNESYENISNLENQGDNIKAEREVEDLKASDKSTDGTDDKIWKKMKSPQRTHSLKPNKKQKGANSLADEKEEASLKKIASKKKITFKPSDLRPESTNRSKVSEASELTVYPKSVSQETVEGLPPAIGDFKASDSLRNFFTGDKYKKETVKNAKRGVDNKSGDAEPMKNSDTKPMDDFKEFRKSWQKESSEIYRRKLQRARMRRTIDRKVVVDSPKDKAKEGVDNESRDEEPTQHAEAKWESPDPNVSKGARAFPRDSLHIHRKNLIQTIDENIKDKEKEINMPDSKSQISVTLSQNKSEINSGDEINAGNEKSSMISLYRNVSEETSTMALTKEELEKLEKTKYDGLLVSEKTQ